MKPCFVVEITTPKKYVLNGLWFGPKKPKQAIVFVHGLTASAFSVPRLMDALVDANTAVLTFNNRGFEKVTEIKKRSRKKTEWKKSGATYEIFTESADDIQGAVNFVRRQGIKNVYLAGHSTGCQKSYYWASRKHYGRGAKGFVLLGPLSDYAGALHEDREGKLKRATAHAKKLVKAGKAQELMPENLGPWFLCSAQRFLSLYTSDSLEEIFSYAQPKKNPRILKTVRKPTLIVLAGNDEHADRPAKNIADWFKTHLRASNKIAIIPRAGHSFKKKEKEVARTIRRWMESL